MVFSGGGNNNEKKKNGWNEAMDNATTAVGPSWLNAANDAEHSVRIGIPFQTHPSSSSLPSPPHSSFSPPSSSRFFSEEPERTGELDNLLHNQYDMNSHDNVIFDHYGTSCHGRDRDGIGGGVFDNGDGDGDGDVDDDDDDDDIDDYDDGQSGDKFHPDAAARGNYGATEHGPSHRNMGINSNKIVGDDGMDISWCVEGGGDTNAAITTAATNANKKGQARNPFTRREKNNSTNTGGGKSRTRRRKMGRSLAGMPRRSCCHLVFVTVNVVAVVSFISMMLAQVLPLIFVRLPLLQAALRGYLTFFCIILFVAELELPFPFVRTSQSLHDFKSKGFLLTFISVVSMEQMDTSDVNQGLDEMFAPYKPEFGIMAKDFINISSFTMLGVGLLYMVMGLVCMRKVRDRCREDYARRMEEWFDLRSQTKVPEGFMV